MKIMLLLLACGISSTCLAAVSFDDVMAASRQVNQACDAQGGQSIDCVVARHTLQVMQEQYERDQRMAEAERMQHADTTQDPDTAETRVRSTDALYLDAYALSGR